MKILVLYDFPPSPAGLATQADLIYRAFLEIGIDAKAVHFESAQEKEWYYRWFKPDVVLGVGYWGHTPHLILHPQRYGVLAVPWFVADGYVANYHEILNALPLIMVTSNWVKEAYIRDGVDPNIIEVMPVGCDTASFIPHEKNDPKVAVVREALGIAPDEIMILTIGGDATSKGAQEIIQALALINKEAPDWKYVCKVWPQPRTMEQNLIDMQLINHVGLEKNIIYTTNVVSRNFVPYLIAACDIYASPSRQEGFGMPMVEAGSCGKPVVSQKAMGMLDTLVHEKTALLADVEQVITIDGSTEGEDSGFEEGHRIVFDQPKTVEYRANVQDLAKYLLMLMRDAGLRKKLGGAARKRVVELYDYKVVAKRIVKLFSERLGIS